MNILGLLLSVLISIVLGVIFNTIYESINHPEYRLTKKGIIFEFKRIFSLFKEKSESSNVMQKFFYIIVPTLSISLGILICLLIPLESIFTFAFINTSILIVVFALITIVLSFGLSAIASNTTTKVFSSKKIINKIAAYYLPLVFGLIAIFLQYISIIGNMNVIPSFKDIINFQTNFSIDILGYQLPAIFIILNPLAAMSFFSAFTGILRVKNFGNPKDQPINIWDPEEEFSGYKKGLILLENNMKIFFYSILFVSLFLGNGKIFNLNEGLNLIVQLSFAFLFILLLAIVGRGKPRTQLERGINWYLRSPMIFSILSILWAYLSIQFGFLNISPL